jgi:hypothetical protein
MMMIRRHGFDRSSQRRRRIQTKKTAFKLQESSKNQAKIMALCSKQLQLWRLLTAYD